MAVSTVAYMSWMGLLIFLLIYWQLTLGPQSITSFALLMVLLLVPPMAAYQIVRLERRTQLGGNGLPDRRWFKIALSVLLAMILALAIIYQALGLFTAVVIAFICIILLLRCTTRSGGQEAAFALLVGFVLSIGAFNALTFGFSLFTTPLHVPVMTGVLWLQRGALRANPARLRRLVRWGVGLSAVLLAVHAAGLAHNLGAFSMGDGSWRVAFPGVPDPFDHATLEYFGFPIPFTLLSAGALLALLPGRRAQWTGVLLAALAVAALAGWLFLEFTNPNLEQIL